MGAASAPPWDADALSKIMQPCAVKEFVILVRRLICGVVAGTFLSLAVSADVLQLKSGGTVEGEIVTSDAEKYVVRTTVGIVTLPASAVESVEKSESPFQEYDRRRSACDESPGAQTELAQWCEDRGLAQERRQHLNRAIELDCDFDPARRELGFVRVGMMWVDGRQTRHIPRKDKTTTSDAENGTGKPSSVDSSDRDNDKVVAAVQSHWLRRFRAIRSNFLDSAQESVARRGRTQILDIRDPLAILPMAKILGGGNRYARSVLVESLATFSEDEATLNLAVIALLDGEESIRKQSLVELVRRNDGRVAAQFRKALASDNDEILRRAAVGLGLLRDAAAVGELIPELTARRWRAVEVPVRQYLNGLTTTFTQPTRVAISSATSISHAPQIGAVDLEGPLNVTTEVRWQNVTVYRTEVLEALKQITGENFGFDAAAWQRWQEERKP
ncbi:MAG: hypothetical protein JNG88_09090 [Phycisphaerales bacterium]|nr:hypothetical protein [Phycisphaerales bacterium]